ncbi:MAG: hypothetical protein ABMA64_12665 [Myxococcota bacterium]|jgi:hypothetical protein
MSMKSCPACGADVPVGATRCKECFHDFTEAGSGRSLAWLGPLIVLGSIAAMAVSGSLILLFIWSQPIEVRALVDEETRSVVWTTKYRTGVETDRLMFDDVVKIEHVGAGGKFQVVAITTGGDRKVITEGASPLDGDGRHYAEMMNKPFEDVDPAVARTR